MWIKFLVDNYKIFRYLKLDIAFAFIVSNEWKIKKQGRTKLSALTLYNLNCHSLVFVSRYMYNMNKNIIRCLFLLFIFVWMKNRLKRLFCIKENRIRYHFLWSVCWKRANLDCDLVSILSTVVTILVWSICHIWAKLGHENLLRRTRWFRWHCYPDTRFEIRAMATFLVTEAFDNTESFI